jgi:leucyl/phenylalanyl-tRNA--protein transferase
MMRLTNGAPELPLSVLRAAYADGWFPMGERGTRLIEWFSPDPRGILPLTGFHVPARLGRTLRAGRFEIRIDAAFAEVMARCAERDDTWISDVITETYTALHLAGEAHSVECWREGRLVGGLYGVSLGGAFFGESMFHVETDASKVALAALVDRLRTRGYALLDLQWVTPHLAQFGATEIRRGHYLQLLRTALARRCTFV